MSSISPGRGSDASAVAIRQSSAYQQIRRSVHGTLLDRSSVGVLSCGERIAVALVLNQPELLPEMYNTVLEAVDRLGSEWLTAAILVHRDIVGWDDK